MLYLNPFSWMNFKIFFYFCLNNFQSTPQFVLHLSNIANQLCWFFFRLAVGIEPGIPIKAKLDVVTGGQPKTQSQVCYMCSFNEP